MQITIETILNELKFESESTIKMFDVLTDESLNQRVYDDGRTLGKIAWHIVQTVGEMLPKMGLDVTTDVENLPIPEKASEIIDEYKKLTAIAIEQIRAKWTDDMLEDELDMYGEKWTRHFAIAGFFKHEIHHRAQMTVLMRQAGLKVPGVFGPAKEEWSAYGMPAME
jgi:uncharacterized damage-inducible protein DinB